MFRKIYDICISTFFMILKDKINSLNNMKSIYNNELSNKLGEYSKFIINYKEKEKIKSDLLINDINKLKKDIKSLQNKIEKKKFEKNDILKWIYFFIKMKEKKLVLPLYYKKILETTIERKKKKRKTIIPKIEGLKLIEEQDKLFLTHENTKTKKDSSNKVLIHIKLHPLSQIKEENEEKEKDKERKSRKSKKLKIIPKSTVTFKKRSLKSQFMKSKNLNNDSLLLRFDDEYADGKNLKKAFEKLIDEGIDSNEINRITKYKMFLIYKTPQDLEDRLEELQNENIQLLRQYEIARKKLFAKKLKLKEILDDISDNNYESLKNKIEEKEIKLNQKIKRNENLKKRYLDAKKNLIIKTNVNIKQKIGNFNNKPITEETLRKELYNKVEKLFDLCSKNISYPDSLKANKDKFKKDIIYMLTVIEFCIDNLKSKLNFKDRSNLIRYDLMRKIKNDIEHRHKIEKGEILRLQEKKKFKNFQEIIGEKMNKILFLQNRRQIPVYNLDNINKKKNSPDKKKLTFEDFMFD